MPNYVVTVEHKGRDGNQAYRMKAEPDDGWDLMMSMARMVWDGDITNVHFSEVDNPELISRVPADIELETRDRVPAKRPALRERADLAAKVLQQRTRHGL